MLKATVGRLAEIAGDDEILIVLGRGYMAQAKEIIGDRNISIIAEPCGRSTAACIGLGALAAVKRGVDEPVAFLPSDHFIKDAAAFCDCLRRAAQVARSGAIVTLGIKPTRPETGYGYIKATEPMAGAEEHGALNVNRFHEKPSADLAQRYASSGEHYWNGGIFVARPRAILSEIERCMPELYSGLVEIERAWGGQDFDKVTDKVYTSLDAVSFDTGVMEKTVASVALIPCDAGWSDVGSWQAVYELLTPKHDARGNLARGEAIFVDCDGSFVSSKSGRTIACLGLKNCLVVDTGEALLVADLERADEIRKVAEKIRS